LRPIGVTSLEYFEGLVHGGAFLEFVSTIVGGAVALAIIASIDALLCAKLVTAPGGPPHRGNGNADKARPIERSSARVSS
jgi:hypothetical protein